MVLTSSGVILGSGSGSFTPLYVKLRDSTFVSIMMWLFPLLLRLPAPLARRFAAERTDSVSYRLRALSALVTRPSSRPPDRTSRPVALSSPSGVPPWQPRPFPPSRRPRCCRARGESRHSWQDVCLILSPTLRLTQ